jgi:hypothetical protein
MLRGKQCRQFIEQVHFELPGDGLGYVLCAAPGDTIQTLRCRGTIDWPAQAKCSADAAARTLASGWCLDTGDTAPERRD